MLQVRRPVNIIAISTDGLKQQLLTEVDAAIDQLNNQVQQVELQGRRQIAELQNTNVHRLVEARRELDEARAQQEEMLRQLQGRRAEIEALQLEAPVIRGEVDGFVQLQVGDNLAEKLRAAEVVIRDDVIISINGL